MPLLGLPQQVFDDEDVCSAAVKTAVSLHVPRPGVPLLKALVGRCLVRDTEAPCVTGKNGRPVADPHLRDTENVPLTERVEDYIAREVAPFAPGAWCDDPEGSVGYEVPFTRLFYRPTVPRPSDEIKGELRELEAEIRTLLDEVLL